mmetsp:Transcript_11659/g.23207  ORF Transcript_11659/g.23207 Transcript_11659/m.23207 type:complete len:662 (-) Transcript_11659:80-2065(-)
MQHVCDTSIFPPHDAYANRTSFFSGAVPPLPTSAGYIVVIAFGLLFSAMVTMLVMMTQKCRYQELTSEYFNTAGRTVKTGLTASVLVAHWTWAATILQSSNVAWQYGISGPFWYAAGATVQILLFGIISIRVKQVAPGAHTFTEIVRARWGKPAHFTFLFFALSCNVVVTSMLLLGGSATLEALTGMDRNWSSFLIPWSVVVYTVVGGLRATFLASYVHSAIIFIILVIMVTMVYVKTFSSDILYDLIEAVANRTDDECQSIFNGYEKGKYACGPVPHNYLGSYLTILSGNGLLFGVTNLIGNFGTVFVDQSYWQSAIAASPRAASRGYFIGGLCWFAIPFSLATALGLVGVALQLPITTSEATDGLVPAAVAQHLMGTAGSAAILIMLFMAIVSSGSAECMAVASLFAYDVYRGYINPNATGKDILRVSRIVIVVFGLGMGGFAIALNTARLHLGWVYLFMGIIIGPAVFPLWNMMTWRKASGTGAVVAALSGLVLGILVWTLSAVFLEGELTISSLGSNVVMLYGNLTSFLSSGILHWIWSVFVDPQDFDFSKLAGSIHLVEEDLSGMSEEDRDPKMLKQLLKQSKCRGYAVTCLLIVAMPLLTVPFGVFSKAFFAFWVFASVLWGYTSAVVIIILPIVESYSDIVDTFYIRNFAQRDI